MTNKNLKNELGMLWAILHLLSSILTTILIGVVANSAWNWFVFPAFDIKSPGLAILIGLIGIIGLLKIKYPIDINRLKRMLLIDVFLKNEELESDIFKKHYNYICYGGLIVPPIIVLLHWLFLYGVHLFV